MSFAHAPVTKGSCLLRKLGRGLDVLFRPHAGARRVVVAGVNIRCEALYSAPAPATYISRPPSMLA